GTTYFAQQFRRSRPPRRFASSPSHVACYRFYPIGGPHRVCQQNPLARPVLWAVLLRMLSGIRRDFSKRLLLVSSLLTESSPEPEITLETRPRDRWPSRGTSVPVLR